MNNPNWSRGQHDDQQLHHQPEQDRDYNESAEPVRYPEPDVLSLDKRFDKYRIPHSPIKRLYTGMLWAEGPA